MSSTCFEPKGSSSGRRLCRQLWYGTLDKHSATYYTAYTDAMKRYHTITVYTTVFLNMYPQEQNIYWAETLMPEHSNSP